ncbi:MAG: type IX secretion system membrane protein PorP/SprF [Caldilineae bacterium]|nr:MAG: type IX secretion system membrane protein PorP/SprF [Caldilineae bacterium]
MNYSRLIGTLLIVMGYGCVWGQDPAFSQFYANRIYLNPAFTGMDPGLTFVGSSRLQWVKVDNGFQTHAATVELQEPFIRSGFGLSVFSNREGLAALRTIGLGFSYAYIVPFRRSNLHFGLQASVWQKSLDWSKLVFSDQLDPVLGVVYPTAAVPGLERVTASDFHAGALFRTEGTLRLGGATYRHVRSAVGLSVHHLPSLFGGAGAVESFQYLGTRVPARVTIHAGTIVPVIIFEGVGHRISLSPNAKFEWQGESAAALGQSIRVWTYGTYALYEGFYLGAFFLNKTPVPDRRNTNALILSFGWYQQPGRHGRDPRLFVGFSMDINTTGVGTSAGNVYELNVRYALPGAPHIFGHSRSRDVKKLLDCKDFLY